MKLSVALFGACALLLATLCGAAAAPALTPPAQATYILGPGDQIDVNVYGEPDLSRTVTIKPDGTVALALINDVTAAGKTTAQLENELIQLYAKFLKAPSVTVVVREFRIDRVYLLGQINKPGDYQLRPNVGIFELLSSAGGPTNRADLAKAVIIRGKTETIKVDLVDAFAKNKAPETKLEAGDVLFIPETDRRIVALGEVNRPGAYDLLEGQHVSDLLAAAGGVTGKAGLAKAFLMRDGAQVPIDLKRVLAGDVEANAALKPGDMLVIPESRDKIIIMGAVNRPGPYDFKDNMTVLDALAQAGGPTDKGNLKAVQIVRLEGGKATNIPVKADQAMTGKDATQNRNLQSGDLVYVPQAGMNWVDLLNTFGWFKVIFGF